MRSAWTVKIVGWMVTACLVADSSLVYGDDNAATGQQRNTITEFVESVHDSFGFRGAVFVGRDGRQIVSTGVGMCGPDSSVPVDSSTLFEIASCTKSFTAIAVLQLEEAGQLKLDDSISTHLPAVPQNCRGITVRHLLQHTSGIPGTNSKGFGDVFADVLPVFLAGGPRHKPGTHWEYWNQGYSLLSEVIANASGMTYQEYCEERIFRPSGMTSTCFTGDSVPPSATVAIGTAMQGASRSALDHPYGSYGYQYRGMGGIVSNLNDLSKWIEALRGGKLLNEESRQAMVSGGEFGYGLGWRVSDPTKGNLVLSHTGSVRGFLASIRVSDRGDSYAIVLARSDQSLPFKIIDAAASEAMFGRMAVVSKLPLPLSKDEIQATVGAYKDTRGRVFTIANEGNVVTATINWGGPKTQGYLGYVEPNKTALFMIKSYKPLQVTIDGAVALKRIGQHTTTVTLADLKPPLSFQRVED